MGRFIRGGFQPTLDASWIIDRTIPAASWIINRAIPAAWWIIDRAIPAVVDHRSHDPRRVER